MKTVMLIVIGTALGFLTGSGKDFPFSVGPSAFCGNFWLESKTRIQIYKVNDVLLINEVHNVIKINNFLRFWPQYVVWASSRRKKKNRKLWRIKRRDLGLIVVAHRFLKREELFNFDKGWALNSDRRQVLVRNFTSGCVGW